MQAIPEKVAQNLKKKLGNSVTLKGPSGNTWDVGITSLDSALCFSHGWPEFVKDHHLQENDILNFKYNGVSQFDVLIFEGGNLCEKASSYFVRKCGRTDHGSGTQTKRKTGESSVEVIPNTSDCEVEGTPSEKTANNDIDKVVSSISLSKKFRNGNSSGKDRPVQTTVKRRALFSSTEEVDEKPGSLLCHFFFLFCCL